MEQRDDLRAGKRQAARARCKCRPRRAVAVAMSGSSHRRHSIGYRHGYALKPILARRSLSAP